MRFTPRDVDRMSLWEVTACWDGYLKANSTEGDRPKPPTEAEHDAMIAKHG